MLFFTPAGRLGDAPPTEVQADPPQDEYHDDRPEHDPRRLAQSAVHRLPRVPGEVPDEGDGNRPSDRARRVGHEEAPPPHPGRARRRPRDYTQARNEAREEHRPRAEP